MKTIFKRLLLVFAVVTMVMIPSVYAKAEEQDECVYVDGDTLYVGDQAINLADIASFEGERDGNAVSMERVDGYGTWSDATRGYYLPKYIWPGEKLSGPAEPYHVNIWLGRNGKMLRMHNYNPKYGGLYDWYEIAPNTDEYGTNDGVWMQVYYFFNQYSRTLYTTYFPIYTWHEGQYEEVIIREPTMFTDGESAMECKRCGHIYDRKPIPASWGWRKEMERAIDGGQPGQVVEIDSWMYNSFPQDMMQRIAAKKDVVYKIKFIQDHRYVTVTVPANTCDTVCDWYGPEKMKSLYPYSYEE